MELLRDFQYCIDTSALVDLKPFWHEVFPSLWRNIEDMIREGRLIAPYAVLEELGRYGDQQEPLLLWAKQNRRMFINLDAEQLSEAQSVLCNFPQLVDPSKVHVDADPFVVALAKLRNAVVVADEKLSPPNKKPKIPNACKKYELRWLLLQQMFVELKWQY